MSVGLAVIEHVIFTVYKLYTAVSVAEIVKGFIRNPQIAEADERTLILELAERAVAHCIAKLVPLYGRINEIILAVELAHRACFEKLMPLVARAL